MIEGLLVLDAIVGVLIIMYACCVTAGRADDETPVIHSEGEKDG